MQTASRTANMEQKLKISTASLGSTVLPHPGILTRSLRVCRSTTYAMLCTNFMHVQCVKHLKRHRASQLACQPGYPNLPPFPLHCHLLPPVVSITFWHRHHLRYSRSGFRLVRNHYHRPPSPASVHVAID